MADAPLMPENIVHTLNDLTLAVAATIEKTSCRRTPARHGRGLAVKIRPAAEPHRLPSPDDLAGKRDLPCMGWLA